MEYATGAGVRGDGPADGDAALEHGRKAAVGPGSEPVEPVDEAKEAGIRYVSHFHYTVWPDHGVPDETATVIKFRNMVRTHMNQRKNNGPAVVHCSAGVGRTGTLIALDALMQQVENEKQVGVFNFIKKMRMNRPFMVQTESQYVFLNHCMKDVIESPLVETENIYEDQFGGDLIYENIGAVNPYGNSNGRLA